jgi:hypothetical protein
MKHHCHTSRQGKKESGSIMKQLQLDKTFYGLYDKLEDLY